MHFGGSRFRGWGPDAGPCGSCSLGLFACCRKAWPAFFPLAAHWPDRRYTLIKNTGDLMNHFYDTCSQGHYALEQPFSGALEHIWRMPAKCPQEGLRRPILSIFAAWPPNVPRKASECPLDVHVGRSSQAYFLERNSAMDDSIGGS